MDQAQMNLRRLRRAAAALLFVLLVGQTAPALRVGATAVDCCAAAYYAADEGFFRSAGVSVDLATYNNGAAVAAGVASGTLDVGISTPMQIAGAVARGLPFVIIAPGALGTPDAPTTTLCVAGGSPLLIAAAAKRGSSGRAVLISARSIDSTRA